MTERPRVELHDLDEIECPVIANQVGFGFGVYKDIHLAFDREGVAIVILVGVCRRNPFVRWQTATTRPTLTLGAAADRSMVSFAELRSMVIARRSARLPVRQRLAAHSGSVKLGGEEAEIRSHVSGLAIA